MKIDAANQSIDIPAQKYNVKTWRKSRTMERPGFMSIASKNYCETPGIKMIMNDSCSSMTQVLNTWKNEKIGKSIVLCIQFRKKYDLKNLEIVI